MNAINFRSNEISLLGLDAVFNIGIYILLKPNM